MPTVFSHAIAATALGQWFPRAWMPPRFWQWTAVCAMLPDADVIGFSLGVRYDDMLGHRGLTHSIPFAVVVGFVAARHCMTSAPAGGRWRMGALWAYFAVTTASHGLLDAITNGGRGIAFLAPLSNHRFFFPWRPIQVSPIGLGFFSPRGLAVLYSEMRWILLPSVIIGLAGWITGTIAPPRSSTTGPL